MIPSVMPKGVEHFMPPTCSSHTSRVIPSVMPKGVEHDWPPPPPGWRVCDSVSDAERR